MWAFLVLALTVTVGASETDNNTSPEEKLDVARGKLLVSTEGNPHTLASFTFYLDFVVLVQRQENFKCLK